jgi:hypothetical protein
MQEFTRLTQPVERPGRLQLAIREWQRQLIEKAKVGYGGRREPAEAASVEI